MLVMLGKVVDEDYESGVLLEGFGCYLGMGIYIKCRVVCL